MADFPARRLLFSIGLVDFTAGSLLCRLAVSPPMLIFSRTLPGRQRDLAGGLPGAERRSSHPMFDLALLRVPTFAGGCAEPARDGADRQAGADELGATRCTPRHVAGGLPGDRECPEGLAAGRDTTSRSPA
jgi:hypothetical protein